MAERGFTDADVARVAKGLTKAQREAVAKADDRYGIYGTKPFRNRLARLGICAFDEKAGRGTSWLWPLGLAVRAFIQEKGNV